MSQVDTTTAAVPIRPWVASRSSQAKGLVAPLMIGIAAYLIVLFTGFAGADGWALLFFLLILAVSLVRSRNLGKTKLINSMFNVVITGGALLAFAPWLSIFYSLVSKGFHGIYLGYFYHDMRVTTPDDELNLGGVGHAIIGSSMMVLIATAITLPLGILSGVYLTEVRGRLTRLVRFVVPVECAVGQNAQ
jgi:phosphate transport system permease protein